MIEAGAIVPHAPVLLPGLRSAETQQASTRLLAAIGALDFSTCDVVVVASPHGSRSGVYREAAGSLGEFGVPGVEARRATDERAASVLARAWGRPRLGEAADHGIVVPVLAGLGGDTPLVPVALRDLTSDGGDAEAVLEDAAALAESVRQLARRGRIAFVASAHTSAALSQRAPLTERAEARRLEERLLDALRPDPGVLARLAPALWAHGGACGAGPLATLGWLFEGGSCEPVTYEAPLGIGYLVARTAPA